MVEKSQAQGTTFVHADACNFMEVVQRLTGPNIKQHPPPPPPPPTSLKESSPSSSSCLNEAEEEKAIRERRFYLHPSPRSLSSRVSDPELLPLFPLTTPRSQGP
ncbi:VQ motif-containing protein 31-like [Dioscorea cayenensis subsp. rotundata]|uniref:VQ motif-containing protein 31-like n=1 Tax=Dioscorea cayennensis subsp. rotundata TaxID=55577 RepID=A0AB40C2T2_DIOCR|nr:VQ motif-containing protein 31-like [Dioscorea cayenensis subsp. rotundata]